MTIRKVFASGRALAAIVLGVALLRVLVERMFSSLGGIKLFLQNYGADRLPPLSPEQRQKLPSFIGCIACGRCDLDEGHRMRTSQGQYPGLMQLVLASSRSMPDFDAASRGFAFVPEQVLRAKRSSCPADLAFDEIAAFVHEKAREIDQG